MVAVAAYRAAERLEDRRQGQAFDYRAKRGVVHQEILLPKGAAKWLGNRETLWNHVEKMGGTVRGGGIVPAEAFSPLMRPFLRAFGAPENRC